MARHFLEFIENGAKDVRFVVGDIGVGEVGEIFCALDDRGHALEAHAGVHMLCGERGERAIGVGIKLDEDEVPDFDGAGIPGINEG